MPNLFLVIAILALAGLLVHLWMTVNRLQRTVRRLQDEVESPPIAPPVSRAAAPAPVPVPAPAPVSAPAPSLAPAPAIVKAPEPEAIDEGVLTAIAAAVAMVIRQPHRLVAIQADASAQRAWSAEGRREIYHSHKVR
jgi:hypothetical protein